MPTLPVSEKPVPALPHPPLAIDLSKFWIMSYRHGMNATLSKNFYFNGSLKEAVERARKHCDIMNYQYYFLRPLVVDIEAEERRQMGLIDFSNAPKEATG